MFTKALIATDLSPASNALIKSGEQFRRLGVSEVVLLHCFGAMEVSSFSFAEGDMTYEKILNEQAEQLRSSGFSVEIQTFTAGVHHGVQEVAEDTASDLIVIGSHGHAIRSGLHLGGRAWGIIQHAIRPVLVMRLEAHGEDAVRMQLDADRPITDSVMFATDFSDNADMAVPIVERLARAGARKIDVAHIQDKAVLDPHLLDRRQEFEAIERERLEVLVARITADTDAVGEGVLGYGKPSYELIKLVEQVEPSLLVMGSHGHGMVREMLIGSVSHAVTRHTTCPVLLVPMPE